VTLRNEPGSSRLRLVAIVTGVALAIICSACSHVAARTYPARPQEIHPPPQPKAQSANRFQAFEHELPLPEFLTHDSIPLSDWHSGPPRPSLIDTRPKRSLGEANYRPWAELLNQIHKRVHLLFADQYLVSLDRLPSASPLQDQSLYAQLELHIVQRTGELATIGLRRSSGVPEFDVAALIAFSKAFPLPIADGLASLNGEAYLTWEVRRDALACTTLHAHPFRLE
jgi:hypothetical protein